MQHDFPKLQSSILKEASRLVKVGGKLVYSTCSISHFENEDVVKNFERSCHEFGDNWQRWQFHDEESPTYSHFKTLLPNMHGSDGFFIARWKRIR
jgi:16S rRNA (cytosine967-C5)-methyltransferase